MSPSYSVLLDLDGTLIDSQPGILASCPAALRALGHEPDETLDIKHIIGPPIEDIMRVLLQPYGDDRVDDAVSAYRERGRRSTRAIDRGSRCNGSFDAPGKPSAGS
jgi:phosphoglycolate phosphatase